MVHDWKIQKILGSESEVQVEGGVKKEGIYSGAICITDESEIEVEGSVQIESIYSGTTCITNEMAS